MKLRILAMAAIAMLVAACEPERGAGFTGIGTQADISAYDLELHGLRPTE